ncbi:Non-specific serine/threonine protein kinase [Vibrio scophthalmi]|uniref:Ig-like domain-containing protein n=1 Tax=Vibrio scophthalmi TaxID=45658 RepID=UPI0008097A91|nr:cadherin-like domain-containing protein [Vibrio scophthalmi]ANS87356.1 Non-specific serine/threonine protein kinase [Vibrio scophthalmi]
MGIGVITMGNLAFGQSMVIDVFGNVRVLNPGETPNEGEVIVTNNADLETNQTNELETVLIGADGAEVELTKDIAEIFSALEEGQDPTQLGDALATAAGGSIGSSLIDSGTVERIGDATIAETEFATQGLEQLGLSRTQSLTLIEQFNVFDPELVSITGQLLGDNVAFITAEDTPLSGRLFASDLNNQDQLTFIQSASPANGEVIVNTDGTWSYTPDENYDGPDRFEVTVSDGNGGTDTITVSVTVTPIPEISITGGGEVNEGDDASYVISFDKLSDQTTTLKLTTELGTAEGNDFGAITVETSSGQQLTVNPDGTVNVPAGTTSLNVTIATSQDDVFEGDESFTLNVEPVTGLVGIGSSDALIKDDGTGPGGTADNDKPTLQVTGGGDVNEGSDAIFDVSLSNKTETDVVLNLAATTDGSYSAESDDLGDMVVTYVDDKGDTQPLTVAENGDVLVPAGITDITVTVPTLGNEIYEGDETLGLVVTDKSNITTNGSDSSNATIKDYGTGPGVTPDNDKPTLQVTGGGDVNEGSDAIFDVSLSNKTEVDVVLNLAPTTDGAYSAENDDLGEMVVTYVDADDKTQTLSVADNGDVTVPAGITEITVTVATSDNEIYEGDETFGLMVTDKSNVTTNGSDSSNATIKDDGTGPGDTPDNDKPTLLVTGGGDVNEGSDATFEVSLSNKTEADVVLNLAPTTDGSYSVESDDLGDVVVTYVDDKGDTQSLAVAENGDVLVPAGITGITVTVPTSDNEIYEGDETFGLVVTDKSNVTTNGSDSSNATIKDDGTGLGSTPDNDKPTLQVTGGGDVNEGSDAIFDVSLSNKTETDVVLNLAPTTDGAYSAESDDLGDMVVTYVDDKGDTQPLTVAENGDVLIPAGITDITVTVPTSDNEIYEGDETFGLVVTDKSNVTTNGSDSSDATIKDDGTGTVNDGKPVDNDKPTLVVSDAKSVAEGESASFAVSLSNPVDSTLTYKFELDLSSSAELDDFAAENGSVMLTVTYVVDGDEKSVEIENGSELPISGNATDMTVAIVTDDNKVFEGQEGFALNVSVSGEVGSDNDSLALEESGTGIITDFEDNPPQSEDFEVNVGSSGKTQVIFDSANTPIDDGSNPDSDHISDREDDADNAADLKIVITELPDNGTLYYKEGDEFFEIIAEHLYSGEGDESYTQFDSNSIHYEADAGAEGFSLGINNQQDSNPLNHPDKGASSQDFYNWGERVDNSTRELKLSDGETITIRSEGGKLTQYSGDANAQHVGHGIGVGGGKGINEGEKLIVEFESRPADSITLGLDGLGGYFEQGLGSSKESSVVITVNYVGGSQTFEFQKDSSGSDELFHAITIPSADFPLPEGTEIESVELSTSGPGNWELRSLETSASDSFDYQAVDSDGNFSDESTVTLNESNNAPIADDDPSSFAVKLGSFNTENNLLWSDDGATISTSANDDKSFDPTTLKQGVSDDVNGGPAGQIQYNRETGESEQFIINLDKPATEFSFTVSNLFKNEGGTGNHEQGKWVAYLNGVVVASDTFTANDGNHQGQFDVTLGDDENLIAFDEIIFEAQDFVDVPARGNDSSDYFVTGFEASSEGAYAVNQGGVLEIPISELLSNDSDIDNDTIRITYVYGETQGEAYIKDGVIYFELNETFVGNTTFEYQITDDKGGFDSATVNVIVNPAATDATVNDVQLLSNSVEEGNDLAFKVTLDSSALKETTLDIDFGLVGDRAGESDVDLSDLIFTNGVTYDQESGQITIPVGVKDFTVLVPTENDGLHELDESYSLQVGEFRERVRQVLLRIWMLLRSPSYRQGMSLKVQLPVSKCHYRYHRVSLRSYPLRLMYLVIRTLLKRMTLMAALTLISSMKMINLSS